MALAWYVVIAKQNQDHVVGRGLREQGFRDVYLPKTYKRVRTSEGRKAVASLLLSPYLFVLLDPVRGEHGPVRNTRGVDRLICDVNDKPECLRDGGFQFIADLRQTEDDEMCAASVVVRVGRPDLDRGMTVRIDKPGFEIRGTEGDLVKMIGVITQIKKRQVQVLVGAKPIWVNEADISEVKAA